MWEIYNNVKNWERSVGLSLLKESMMLKYLSVTRFLLAFKMYEK